MRQYEKIREIVYMLLLIPLMKPEYFDQIPLLDTAFNIMRILSAIVILLIFFRGRKHIDAFMLFMLLYWAEFFLITVAKEGDIYVCFAKSSSCISLLMLLKIMLDDEPRMCFRVLLPVLEILLYVNLITIIIFPEGMYTTVDSSIVHTEILTENWFLGMDNAQAPFYALGITVSVLKDYRKTGSKSLSLRSLALIFVCVTSVAIRWQATAVVGMALILLALIIPGLLKKASGFLNARTYLILIGIFFFAIVFFHVQDHLSFLITDVLHKDITFSGRTAIWERTVNIISKSPWTGWGLQPSSWGWAHIGHWHAHNIFLQVLMCGGILLLVPFLSTILLSAKKLMKAKSTYAGAFLSAVLLSMLLMNQLEVYGSAIWFAVFLFAYNVDCFTPANGDADGRKQKKLKITFKFHRPGWRISFVTHN